jgi:hypothetical protein
MKNYFIEKKIIIKIIKIFYEKSKISKSSVFENLLSLVKNYK